MQTSLLLSEPETVTGAAGVVALVLCDPPGAAAAAARVAEACVSEFDTVVPDVGAKCDGCPCVGISPAIGSHGFANKDLYKRRKQGATLFLCASRFVRVDGSLG